MSDSKRVLFLPGYYVRAIHRGVSAYAAEAGWYLDASMAHSGKFSSSWKGDGILAFSADRRDIVENIKRLGIPAVEMFNGEELLEHPRVLLDNFAIGRMAGEYLVSLGFEHIGYCFVNPTQAHAPNEQERSCGLRDVVERAGRTFHALNEATRREHMGNLPRPLALMVQSDTVGSRLIDALLREGEKIPEGVAVIGVENDSIYQHTSRVSQTCVASNVEYQGYRAAQLLDELMNGKPAPGQDILIPPSRVVERASTSCFATSNALANKALAFMKQHCTESLTAEKIARQAGVGSHQLNRCFKRHLGESISKSLLRMRMSKAMERLAGGEDKIEAVALESGFRSAAYFSTVFRRETGLTPAAFRRSARSTERDIGPPVGTLSTDRATN